MKKLFVMGAIALAGLVSAQTANNGATAKGKWMVGSNLGLNFSSENATTKESGVDDVKTTTTRFSFNPDASYFLADNLAVGIGLDYTYTSVKDGKSSNAFGIMPNIKYFFPQGQVSPFVGLGVGYRLTNQNAGGNSKDITMGGLAVGVEGGIAYFITDALAATASVKYDYTSITHSDNSDYQTQTGLINAGIGAAYFF
ncbi:porin family protein [Weeksellaceae bacterium TAE3-ERU29]|nr:porin family protein [Weeksellaceae bacterium TAE3-ERU29]